MNFAYSVRDWPVNRVPHRGFPAAAHRDSARVGERGDLTDFGDARREIEALRERISMLNAPS